MSYVLQIALVQINNMVVVIYNTVKNKRICQKMFEFIMYFHQVQGRYFF